MFIRIAVLCLVGLTLVGCQEVQRVEESTCTVTIILNDPVINITVLVPEDGLESDEIVKVVDSLIKDASIQASDGDIHGSESNREDERTTTKIVRGC